MLITTIALPVFFPRKARVRTLLVRIRTLLLVRIDTLKVKILTLFKEGTFENRIHQRAQHVLETAHKRRYHKKCLLRYARKHNYEINALLRIVTLLRVRRQHVLKAADTEPFKNPRRSLFLLTFSFKLLFEMEEIFIELYKITGNEDFMYSICEARFVTPKLIDKMIRARHEYQVGNPPQEDIVQGIQ